VTHGGLEMLSETAGSRAGMRETLSDGALQRGRDERGRNPVLCAACHKPIRDADTGRPKRFCGDACRKRSHRRDQAKGIRRRAADDRSLTRDEAVMQLSYAIKTADGLRAGLDALVRIVAEDCLPCRYMSAGISQADLFRRSAWRRRLPSKGRRLCRRSRIDHGAANG
jgi:hypothetical protein